MPPPKEKALQVHNFIWCEKWPLQSFNCIQHRCIFYYFVFLWDFLLLTELQTEFSSILLQCRCPGLPLHVQTTEENQHLEEGDYNCLMYKNVQWHLLTYIL